MTTWIKVTATSTQDISIGTGATRAFLTATQQHVPGSVLRGALAAAWRTKYGDGRSGFRETFDADVRFGPLIPENGDAQNQSVWKCKYHKDNANHPEYVDLAFAEGLGNRDNPDNCGRGGQALKGGIDVLPEKMRVVTSTAIDPEYKTALDGSLFSRESLKRQQTYIGYIVGDAALLKELTTFEHVFIGGKQSVMGHATLEWESLDGPPGLDGEVGDRVVVRTVSPTILLDEAGRPTTDLASALDGVKHYWAERSTSKGTGGWHAASGVPKPTDIAIAAGAVAVLQGWSKDDVAALLTRGLGTRRAEGFGWIEVVPKPWQAADSVEVTSSALPDGELHDTSMFTRSQRKAIANWLRDAGSIDIETLWTTAAGKNFTQAQRDRAEAVLRDTRPENRATLATHYGRS